VRRITCTVSVGRFWKKPPWFGPDQVQVRDERSLRGLRSETFPPSALPASTSVSSAQGFGKPPEAAGTSASAAPTTSNQRTPPI
jgi:hypothetical protein